MGFWRKRDAETPLANRLLCVHNYSLFLTDVSVGVSIFCSLWVLGHKIALAKSTMNDMKISMNSVS